MEEKEKCFTFKVLLSRIIELCQVNVFYSGYMLRISLVFQIHSTNCDCAFLVFLLHKTSVMVTSGHTEP